MQDSARGRMMEVEGITKPEFEERISNCLSEMRNKGIDLMCVYGDAAHPENLIYLANYRPICTDMPGYGGYNALFLLTLDGEASLIIDRDWQVDFVREDSWVENILPAKEGDIIGVLKDVVGGKKLGRGRIELDATFIPAAFYKELRKALGGAELDEASRITAHLRETKTEHEIAIMTRGLEILSRAHDRAVELADEGISEIDLAQEIRHTILSGGAEYTTALFVDGGRRSTIPLAGPMASDYRLKYGDMVLVSIFCVYENYSAGMDRSWVLGEPSKMQRSLEEVERLSMEKALGMVKAGVSTADFMKPVYYDFAEPMLREAGIAQYNIQGYVGHGIGVKIFETPVLWKINPVPLRPGMVIDMEPGVYAKDPSIGGMRTSELIVVTENGYKIMLDYPRRIGSWK